MLFRLLQSGYSGKEIFYFLLIMLFALTISFSVHEFMHAFVATRLGDFTPRLMGRLTLDPRAHVDPIGAVCLLLCGFGWGKPVVYNPSNLKKLKNKRLMKVMVSLGGVFANFCLALICRVILAIVLICIVKSPDVNNIFDLEETLSNPALRTIVYTLSFTDSFCMSLLAFNLLPIPPLDGFSVLNELLPYKVQRSDNYRQFMMMAPNILFALIIVASFSNIDIFGTIMGFIQLPFNLAIDGVCGLVFRIAGV